MGEGWEQGLEEQGTAKASWSPEREFPQWTNLGLVEPKGFPQAGLLTLLPFGVPFPAARIRSCFTPP